MPSGGKRKGAGRKPLAGTKMMSVQLRMPVAHIVLLRAIGSGNVSRGARILCQQRVDDTPATPSL